MTCSTTLPHSAAWFKRTRQNVSTCRDSPLLKRSLANVTGTHNEKHVMSVWDELMTGFAILGPVALTALYGALLSPDVPVSLVEAIMDGCIWESLSANDGDISLIVSFANNLPYS